MKLKKNLFVKGVHTQAKKRQAKHEYTNIIELIAILAKAYFDSTANNSLKISSPFDNEVTLGLFDNSRKKPLQLKIMTNAQTQYPGSTGKNWLHYATWAKHLDDIDSTERDITLTANMDKTKITQSAEVTTIDKLNTLLAQISLPDELFKNKKNEDLRLIQRQSEKILKKLQAEGTAKKELATVILSCLSWCPKEDEFEWDTVDDILTILDKLLKDMQKELKLPLLETEQSRAADSLFFVTVCEHFRIPGADKYMRSCLRTLIQNENFKTFTEIFGTDLNTSVCTLSPTGGTKATRCIFTSNKKHRLTPMQRYAYNNMSKSSLSNDNNSDTDEDQKTQFTP